MAGIGRFHAEGLNIMDSATAQEHQARLDERMKDMRQVQDELRTRITALRAWTASERGSQALIHRNQADLLNKRFIERLQEYQSMERDYRAKYRARVERQIRLGRCAHNHSFSRESEEVHD